MRVSGIPSGVRLAGRFAGQALHFTADAGDSTNAESFAAVPIDSERSLGIVLHCSAEERTDSLVVRLEVRGANYRVDHLTVAPKFAQPPDSATAERIRERACSRGGEERTLNAAALE